MNSADNFQIIKNGIDERLEIIVDNNTGFYNITKISQIIYDLQNLDNDAAGILATSELKNEKTQDLNIDVVGIPTASEQKIKKTQKSDKKYQKNQDFYTDAVGIPTASKKHIPHWFENQSNEELIENIKKEYSLNEVKYELRKKINKKYLGTYVHKYLFDFIVAWLDPMYAIKIAKVLNYEHEKANKYKDELITQQSNKIDSLESKIDNQTKQINKLLGYAEDIKDQNEILLEDNKILESSVDNLNDSVNELEDKVDVISEHLVNKSIDSIIKPINTSKVNYFALLRCKDDNGKISKLIRSQKGRIERELKKYKKTHDVIIPIKYTANAIILAENAKNKVNDYIRNLKKERIEYNRTALANNLPILDQIMIYDIPVKFTTTKLTYEDNIYISYQKIVDLILETNAETQASPMDRQSP